MRWLVLTILLVLPHTTLASVYLSEIAWMGTTNSANDEWLELHNDGTTSVSLAGWRLTDGANFDITLDGAGSIAPGAYAVLERTDDSSAPGSAFYIYTGSLPNTGATLRLYDIGGSLVDQVAGGENWENIGGDNATKATAQYTSSGWITADATPGVANATANVESTSQTETNDTSVKKQTTGGGGLPAQRTTQSKQQRIPMGLSLNAPDIGFVAQPITFEVQVEGTAATSKAGRYLHWNLGDTHTATGNTVTHQYQYPGTYIVSLRGEYRDEEVHVTHELTVLPVRVAITRAPDGAVQLSNTSKYQLDISNYTFAAAGGTYTLPPDTLLAANAAITIPPEKLPVAAHELVAVHNQAERVVAYHAPAARTQLQPVTPTARFSVAAPPPASGSVSRATEATSFTFASAPQPQTSSTSTSLASAPAVPLAAAAIQAIPAAEAGDTPTRNTTQLAYLGLIALLVLAVIALLNRRVTADFERNV